jgi:hypothetical protein
MKENFEKQIKDSLISYMEADNQRSLPENLSKLAYLLGLLNTVSSQN